MVHARMHLVRRQRAVSPSPPTVSPEQVVDLASRLPAPRRSEHDLEPPTRPFPGPLRICHIRHMLPSMAARAKPLVWLRGEIKTPPFSKEARLEAGVLLRQLQLGMSLSLPHSRPMPTVGTRCHERRIADAQATWRVMYRIDPDAIVRLDVFTKKTARTPKGVVENCRRRLRQYDAVK